MYSYSLFVDSYLTKMFTVYNIYKINTLTLIHVDALVIVGGSG